MSAGGVLVHHFRFGPDSLVWLPNSAAQDWLRGNPFVVSVIPNRQLFPMELVPQEPPFCDDCGGGEDPGTQRVPLGVGRIGARLVSFTGSGVGVAVMDTGINGQHRDFLRADGTRVVSPNCFKDASVTSCDSDVSSMAGGHGTKVAGVIAAVNNTVDLVGVAPESTIYNVNVFRVNSVECPGSFCATDADLIDGLEWILLNPQSPPIQAVNVSLGRRADLGANQVLKDTFQLIQDRDIVTVVAAGNWPNLGNDPTLEVKDVIPAQYPSVMAIASTPAALGSDDGSPCSVLPHVPADTASWFTVDGLFDPNTRTGVTVSAPGEDKEDIVSRPGMCGHQEVGLEVLTREGGVARAPGTSFASPHVAGVVALMKHQARTLGTTVTKISAQDKIRSTATRRLEVPLDSTHPDYSFDGEREGIVWAPGALQ